MSKCKTCVYLNQKLDKVSFICSILKIKHPTEPGLYIKNPESVSCYCYKSINEFKSESKSNPSREG